MPRSKKNPRTMDRSGLPKEAKETFIPVSKESSIALLSSFAAVVKIAEAKKAAGIPLPQSTVFNWRYTAFFSFLQISPSYDLARRLVAGDATALAGLKPRDIDHVIQIYRELGDVNAIVFFDWYTEMLQPALERQGTSTLKARPGRPGRQKAEGGRNGNDIHDATKEKLIELKHSRVREHTVEQALRLIHKQIGAPYLRLFVLGQRAGISPVHNTDENVARRNAAGRDVMDIMTSQRLQRAYRLAEHAARGRFPCLDPLDDDPGRPVFHAVTMRTNDIRSFTAVGERAQLFWQRLQGHPDLSSE